LTYYTELFTEIREAEIEEGREQLDKIVTIERTPVNMAQINRDFVRGTAAPRQRLIFPPNT